MKNKHVMTLVLALSLSGLGSAQETNSRLHDKLSQYILERVGEFDQISDDRKENLQLIADYIFEKRSTDKPADVLFICTHNSRRSQMGQLWLAAAALYYGIDHTNTYSGGTEATAFNPRAVAAMKRAGFTITSDNDTNPRYEVSAGVDLPLWTTFSKVYSHESNPDAGFCAVMVCSEADKACPSVEGADDRIGHPYVDPKLSDGTKDEEKTYDERCEQIAREMLYVMHQVDKKLKQ